MPTVGFLTCAAIPNLTADDRLVVGPLSARGMNVEPAVWTDDTVDYGRFDLVVIRSTWDWYRDAPRFTGFLKKLEQRVRVCNPRAYDWLDKRYLLQLAARRLRIPTTHVVENAAELESKLGECPGPYAVLKPATAAGGHGTAKFAVADQQAAHAALNAIVTNDVALLQPYFDAVETDGEWSLLFYGGQYSHAVKKRPKRGDFRVHEEFGGAAESAVAPPEVLESARDAIDASGGHFLYVRVDGIVIPELGGFCVTELEVVEPELFLRMDAAAPERFAQAVEAAESSL